MKLISKHVGKKKKKPIYTSSKYRATYKGGHGVCVSAFQSFPVYALPVLFRDLGMQKYSNIGY